MYTCLNYILDIAIIIYIYRNIIIYTSIWSTVDVSDSLYTDLRYVITVSLLLYLYDYNNLGDIGYI